MGMLFSEVVALGIAGAPRYGCTGTRLWRGISACLEQLCLFSQEPRADDCLRLEVTERQQYNASFGCEARDSGQEQRQTSPIACWRIAEESPTAGETQRVQMDTYQWAGQEIYYFFFFDIHCCDACERHFCDRGGPLTQQDL